MTYLIRLAAGVGISIAVAAAPAGAAVTETPVSFSVKNTNTTAVPCTSDGADYTVRGTLVAPSTTTRAVTLYLHAVTWNRDYFAFKGAPGYDFATQLAERGHASVIIDRLGYGASDHPPGTATCFGSAADVAHQIVGQLRGGQYDGAPSAFDFVFLSGSSVGGLIANLEAETYEDVDGIINQSWGDIAATPYTGAELIDATARCGQGGDPETPGYAVFASSSRDTFYFSSATPDVRAAVPAGRPDPCGEIQSLAQAVFTDGLQRAAIKRPVLVTFGTADAVFGPAPLAIEQTALRYVSSPKVTQVEIPDASHYPLIEANHMVLTDAIDAWLGEQTDGAAAPPVTDCQTKRRFRIKAKLPRGFRPRRVIIRANGTVIARRKTRKRVVKVNLTVQPAGRNRVTLTFRGSRKGKRGHVRVKRTYKLCAALH